MDPTWFAELAGDADREALRALRPALLTALDDPRWERQQRARARVSDLRARSVDWSGSSLRFGLASDLIEEERERLHLSLDELRPWKKGPFEIFGTSIDAEWRSDLKWERLLPWIGRLDGQMVADIGCHNGYYMYRMQALGARTVLGFEPHAGLAHVFAMLQDFHFCPELHFEGFGIEHCDLFGASFDTIFCLGILYHHTDPVGMLRKLRKSLGSGGRVFVDCQGIAGEEPLSLTPASRYAGAAGNWFLPTLPALRHWATRAGFSRVEKIYSAPLTSEEQRATPWAPVKSLSDFLHPEDPTRTIEGYPAPWRHYLLLRP